MFGVTNSCRTSGHMACRGSLQLPRNSSNRINACYAACPSIEPARVQLSRCAIRRKTSQRNGRQYFGERWYIQVISWWYQALAPCHQDGSWWAVGQSQGGPPFPSRFVPFSRQCQWKSCALDQQWVITGLKYDKRWTCDHRVPVLCSIVSLDLLSNASVHSFAAWAFCSFVLCAQFFQSKVRIVTKHLVFVLGWLSTVALVTTTEGVGSFARCYTAKHISTVKISITLGDFSVSPIPDKTAISY